MGEKEARKREEQMFLKNAILINQLDEAKEIIRKMLFVLGEYRVDYHNNPHHELIDKAEAFLKELAK